MPNTKKEPDAVDKYVGQRLRARRMQIGMSQETLGNAVGVSFQQIQKNERGINRLGASRLQQVANVLGVAPSYFFEGAPGSDAHDTVAVPDFGAEFLATRDGLALAQAFTRITNPQVRHRLVGVVEALAEA